MSVMGKNTAVLLFVVVSSVLLTSCWDRHELNDLAIVDMIGLDKQGDDFIISLQIIDPAEATAGEGARSRGDAPVTNFTGHGRTVSEAMAATTSRIPRRIYLSHLRMVIIGEALAREGIADFVDFISREREFRADYYFAVVKGKEAREMMSILTPIESIPARKLYKTIITSHLLPGANVKVEIDDLIASIAKEEKQLVLPTIKIEGDIEQGSKTSNLKSTQPMARIPLDGIAVFKKDKLVGWLTKAETISYNYIVNNIVHSLQTLPCEDNKQKQMSIFIIRSKTKTKVSQANGKPQIKLTIFSEAMIEDVQCQEDLLNNEVIKRIEEKLETAGKAQIQHTLKKVQKQLKTDIFGMGKAIHRGEPKLWGQIKEEWQQIFVNTPIEVNVDVKIRRTGTISQTPIEPLD